MKTKIFALLFPAMIWLAACDSPGEEKVEENNTEVRVEENNTPPERDTVFIGVEGKDEEKSGVEIKVEEKEGDVDFEIKGGN